MAYADISENAKQCFNAAEKFLAEGNVRSFIKQKFSFVGKSGNYTDFDCVHGINVMMFFEGSGISGYYSYSKSPEHRINFRGQWYSNDSLYLEEQTKEGWINYTFKGIMKDGHIKGLWSKGQDKKGFAFYATEKK